MEEGIKKLEKKNRKEKGGNQDKAGSWLALRGHGQGRDGSLPAPGVPAHVRKCVDIGETLRD